MRLRADLTLQGNIDVRQVNLSFKVGGRITTLLVDEGDKVAAGQVLATLDQRYFEDDLQRAKAQRDQARGKSQATGKWFASGGDRTGSGPGGRAAGNAAKAEDDLLRADGLWPSHAISAQDLDLCQVGRAGGQGQTPIGNGIPEALRGRIASRGYCRRRGHNLRLRKPSWSPPSAPLTTAASWRPATG